MDEQIIKEYYSDSPLNSIELYMSSLYNYEYINGVKVYSTTGKESEYFGYPYTNGCNSYTGGYNPQKYGCGERKKQKREHKLFSIPSDGNIRDILVKKHKNHIGAIRIECEGIIPMEYCSNSCRDVEWCTILCERPAEKICVYGIRIILRKNKNAICIVEDIQLICRCQPMPIPIPPTPMPIPPLPTPIPPPVVVIEPIPLLPPRRGRRLMDLLPPFPNMATRQWYYIILFIVIFFFFLIIILCLIAMMYVCHCK